MGKHKRKWGNIQRYQKIHNSTRINKVIHSSAPNTGGNTHRRKRRVTYKYTWNGQLRQDMRRVCGYTNTSGNKDNT